MLIRIRSLTAALMAVLLLGTLAPLPIARAATQPMSDSEAIVLLQAYSIVRGDTGGNLQLDQPLTRAQAAAIFVRSYNAEDLARVLATLVPFPDAKNHWAAGEIAMVERLGLMKGDPSGNFRPDAEITYAEVLTVMLRMVEQEPTGPWSPERIMSAATQLGIAPANVSGSQRAVRGKIFWALATTINDVPLPSGQTLLQKYVDSTPPVLRLDQASVTTTDRSVTITGTATDAYRVTVDGRAASLNGSTGKFTYTANLDLGSTDFLVEAFDRAGNKATATFTATRRANVSRIEITGPEAVKAGSSTKLTVKTLDSQGNEVTADGLQAEISGVSATFDVSTMTLRAGNTTGRGTLTLRVGTVSKSFSFDVTSLSEDAYALEIASINNGRSPSVGKAATVTVHVVDEDGKLLKDDYFRTVTLTASGLTGITISPQSATTEAGVATFTVTGTKEGAATLTARSSGLEEAVTTAEFLSSTRVILTATPTSLRPDGTQTATIRATLQDENGRTITNSSDSDIKITVTSSGTDGTFTDTELTIRTRASTSSGDDAVFKAGIVSGTATITGTITSSHKYSVQTLSLPVNATLPGVKLQVTGPTTRQTPGSNATITVRVLDNANRVVTAGSYAFQLEVTSSNKEEKINGLPEGVELYFTNSDYRPVDDGRSANDPLKDPYSVVGRTHQGIATLTLGYDKSGVLTVTPKLVAGSSDAYHPTNGFLPASPSTHMTAQPFDITFSGTAAGIKLTVDSALGKDQPGGAVAGATTMTVRAQVVDASGAPVPGYNSDITLTRGTAGDLVTNISGANKKKAVNGVAEFTVQATNNAGFDLYTAASGALNSNTLSVAVRKEKADTPNIAAIRGVKTGDPSPVIGYVAPDADYMDIQLFPQVPPLDGEPHYWVTAKVYRKGESSPFFTSDAFDLNADLPVIRIPKSKLRTGKAIYEVSINNGAGDSSKSPDLGLSEAVNAVYSTSYRINSALYDAQDGRLVISASSLASNGVLDPSRLTLVKDDHQLNLGAATIHSISSSAIDLRLGDLAPMVDPDIFHGVVKIHAEDGWFTSADGSTVAKASDTAQVKPMAVITHATLEESTRRLELHGIGFSQGTLALNLVQFKGSGEETVALKPGSSSSSDKVSGTTDTKVTITLSQATLDAVNSLVGPDIYLTAEAGWLRNSSSGGYRAGAITGTSHKLYVKAAVTSAQYNRTTNILTLKGSGFTGVTLDPDKLSFRARGTTTTWAPTGTTTVTVADDATIQIEWSAEDATAFESRFGGRSVLLNTDEGWLIDSKERYALPIPEDTLLFSVLAQ